jgi:flagellar biogenesis protein FliO
MKAPDTSRDQAQGAAARTKAETGRPAIGGLAGWLLRRFGAPTRPTPKLALIERITLAPRQTVALIEADGRRLLIATSPEGASAFYALDDAASRAVRSSALRNRAARVS